MPMSSPLHSRSRSNLLDPDRGGAPEAMNLLEDSPPATVEPLKLKPATSSSGYLRGWLPRSPIYFLIAWAIVCVKIAKDSIEKMDTTLRGSFFYEAFLYYNPLVMVAMMVWLWGVNLWAFLHYRVNYSKIFDLDQNHLTHKHIWKVASWMTIVISTSMTTYLYLYSNGEANYAASQPAILYIGLPLVLILPFDVLYRSSRFFFLGTLLRLSLPLQPITFADFFVADVLTSMSKVLSDIERSLCRMYHRQAAFEAEELCGSHSIWIPCILALPYLFRFAQCLRQYTDTKERSCLFNALKYSTAFPVVFLSALKYHVLPEYWEGVYRPLWLLSSVVNSFYSFYWDISRDWDFSLFSGISRTKNLGLRAHLVYNPRWVYYWAIGSNLLLRCAWTYKLSAHLRHNYLTVFTFSGLEMLRRFQWIFFRVENEHNRMLLRTSSSPETEMGLLATDDEEHVV
ncbi:SPX and EXS domain-containing protein 3 [Selaginella moellendorffii]|uniref:SPX and EXS domain-containing protein 3 n=1 Tax=Selaginella moellendorffii TaxID=88036 RepID=UPI000D1C6449|nr:SPX and EXS domain-containing protein 3 [Selaginella moellendorffii]|eukprot:XP_024527676.1 SPX and EXS domain-containing protein 3 [Selaginella moellendorffii]